MSTLRISNIEAKSVPASATVDEKVKITNSSGDTLVFIDGKTSGITTVGINTTDSNITFDANSNVVVTGIITATKFSGQFEPTSVGIADSIFHTGDTNTSINFPSADTVTIETAGDERLRIISDGKVGINRTSPNHTLEVGGNVFLTSNTSNVNEGSGLLFQAKTGGFNSTSCAAIKGLRTSDTSSYLVFETGVQERLRILSDGKIGIGITNPTSLLYVNGVSTNDIITARAADSNGNSIINILSEGTTGNSRIKFSDTAGTDGQISYSHNDRAMIFAAAGTTEKLRITAGAAEQATLIIDNAQTNGNTWIGDNYTASATEYTCTIGNMYSGAGFFAGYGLKPKSDGWGFVSSTDAYADRKSALTLNGSGYDAFRIDATNANTTHTTGADVTTNKVFAVKHNGDVDIPDGNLIFANGHGIDFSATGGPTNGTGGSELFKDYEEGSFTPYVRTNNNTTEPTYHHRVGLYTRIGNLVTYVVRITTSGELSTGSGATEIWGLPFAASNWTTGDWPGGADIAYYNNLRGSYGTHPRLLGPYRNSTYVRFHIFDNQDDTGYNQYNHIFTNNTIMIAYGQYYTG